MCAASRAEEFISSHRERAERLVRFADHLDPPDRDLVRQVFERGTPVAVLARITGHRARRLHTRLRRVLRRLEDPLTRFVLARAERWPEPKGSIAIDWFVRGRSLRRLSHDHQLSLHRIRREVESVRSAFELTADELAGLPPRRRSHRAHCDERDDNDDSGTF